MFQVPSTVKVKLPVDLSDDEYSDIEFFNNSFQITSEQHLTFDCPVRLIFGEFIKQFENIVSVSYLRHEAVHVIILNFQKDREFLNPFRKIVAAGNLGKMFDSLNRSQLFNMSNSSRYVSEDDDEITSTNVVHLSRVKYEDFGSLMRRGYFPSATPGQEINQTLSDNMKKMITSFASKRGEFLPWTD